MNASASTLFDTTHQSRAIELLIMFAEQVFDFNETDEDDDNRQENNLNKDTISLSSCQTVPNIYKEEVSSTMSSSNAKNLSESNFRISKSATCSSIMNSAGAQPRADSSKQSIVEARRQFFNACGGNPFDKSGGTKNYLSFLVSHAEKESKKIELSPFSQISLSSSSPRNKVYSQSPNKTKRLVNFHHHSIGEQPKPQTANDKMYNKNNEISKSSSSLYSFLKPDFSVAHNNNEDMV